MGFLVLRIATTSVSHDLGSGHTMPLYSKPAINFWGSSDKSVYLGKAHDLNGTD